MHIAIEGFDGVGKSTTAQEVARRLGFQYVEKPLSMVTDPEGGHQEYLRFTRYINQHTDLAFRAMIYGAGTYLLSQRAKTENIVTDRHLCSMFAINATGENDAFFDYLVTATGKPDLTVILFAEAATRRQRIIKRDPNAPDLRDKVFSDDAYNKMRRFVERYQMPYLWIDSTHMGLGEVVDAILHHWTQSRKASQCLD